LVIDVFTLFPEWFGWFLSQRHVRNALREGHDLRFFNYRDTTPLSHGQVDDEPYGGGAGMVIRVDVVDAALKAVYGAEPDASLSRSRVVVLSAAGRRLDESLVSELASLERLALLCGRYEGIDQRVADDAARRMRVEEVSIGDYVLPGGESAALVMIEAVVRLLPDVLGNPVSHQDDSHSDGLLEGPSYTRPASWRGLDVPAVLLSGDHAKLAAWRREQVMVWRATDESPVGCMELIAMT
jgi:tRNA (guanine37-N1)-methyltransferase